MHRVTEDAALLVIITVAVIGVVFAHMFPDTAKNLMVYTWPFRDKDQALRFGKGALLAFTALVAAIWIARRF